jgi:DNA polymerase V
MAAGAKQDREDLPGMAEASNETTAMMMAALHGIRKIWQDVFTYSKGCVVTADLLRLGRRHAGKPSMPET